MDIKELYMSLVKDSHTHLPQGIKANPPEIISSHRMEKLLQKGHYGLIAQFHAIQGYETTPLDPPSTLQQVLDTYSAMFELPTRLPPTRGEHDHSIPLLSGSQPPNVCPYRYPFAQKNEIEKIIREHLAVGVIRLSTIPYSSPIVMVLNKESNWRICPDFRALNKLTIKEEENDLLMNAKP